MSDEKRMEKLLKRAKPFLDEKLKAKQRLSSLWNFLDNANEQDQCKFFQEHDYPVYTVMYDCFSHQVDKIKSREKPEKPLPVTSKEVNDLMRILQILRKIFAYLPEKMRSGWQRRSIVGVLHTLLATTNHPKLRIEGFRLLLMYLGCQTSESSEIMPLFANAMPLAVFDAFPLPNPIELAKGDCEDEETGWLISVDDGINSGRGAPGEWKGEGKGRLGQTPIEWERRVHTFMTGSSGVGSGNSSIDKTSLLPSNTPFTSYDCVDLFEEILHSLVVAAGGSDPTVPIQPAPASRTISSLSSRTPSFGDIRQSITNAISDTRSSGGRYGNEPSSTGRPEDSTDDAVVSTKLEFLWEIFKKYYLRLLFPRVSRKVGMEVEDGEGFATCPPQLLHCLINFLIRHVADPSSSSSPLRTLLLGTDSSNHDMVHEWLRQAMLLPYVWSDVTRGAIGVIRIWCNLPNDERPPFLRFPAARQSVTGSDEKLADDDGVDPNVFLRRYIRTLRLAFLEKPDSVEYIDSQMSIFNEVLSLYRFLTLDTTHLSPSRATWHTLTSTLLDITSQVLCQTDPCAVVHNSTRAAEIADILLETVFCTWVRIGLREDEIWRTLRKVIKTCTRWRECIVQWEKTTMKLTRILSHHVYSIDLDVGSNTDLSRQPSVAPTPTSATSATTVTPHSKTVPTSSTSSGPTRTRDRSQSIYSTGGPPKITSTQIRTRSDTSNTLHGAKSESDLGGASRSGVSSPEPRPAEKAWAIGSMAGRSKEGDTKTGSVGTSDEVTDGSLGRKNETGVVPPKNDKKTGISVHLEAADNPSRIPILSIQRSSPTPEFEDLSHLPFWDAETALFAWKNVVCVLGDVNEIQVASNHALAIACLMAVWDTLEKIRMSQPYEGDVILMPPLFQFATWFFKAADLGDEYAEGRAIAYESICKMMCRRHDQPFPEDYFSHFFRLLAKGFASDDRKVVYAILANCRKLFALGLPGSYILIQPFMKCIRNLFVDGGQKADAQNIPESIRQDAIVILSSLIPVSNHYGRQEDMQLRRMSSTSQTVPTLQPSRQSSKDGMYIGSDYSGHIESSRPQSVLSRREVTPPRPISTNQLGAPPRPPTPSPAAIAAAAAAAARAANKASPSTTSPRPVLLPPSPAALAAANRVVTSTMPVSPQFRPSVAHSPDGGGYLFPTVSSPQTQMPSPELAIPILGHMQTADPPTMSFLELKLTIKDILLALITEERSPSRHEKNPETLALLMWSISVLAFEEMIGCQRPVKEVVDDCINTLLDHLTVTNLKVVHAAADALTLFAHNYKLVNYLDKPILQGVVEKIVGALTEQMLFQHGLTSKQVRGYLVSRLLYCLLEWVMILPPDLWAVPKVAHMVFEVIENALSASDGGHGSVGSGSESDRSIQSSVRKPRMSIHEAAPFLVNTAMGTREGSSSFPRDRRSMMISDGKPTATDRAEVSATTNGLNQPTAKSSFDDQDGDSNLIMETAENVLTHIIHHVNNFAQPCGAAMLGSQLIDPALTEDPGKDGERYLYFTYNKTTLITVIDMPGRTPLDSRARLIIRDMTGRYSWDTYLFYEDLQKMRLRTEQQTSLHLSDESMDDAPARFDADPCQYQGIVSALKLADDISFEENVRRFVPDPVTYVREQGTMPEWKENTGVETADMLDELLQYIGTAHPDCLLRDSTPLNVPPELHAPARDAVGEMGKQLQRQIDAERQCAEFFVNDSLGETVQRIHVTNGEARRIEPHPPPVDMTTESSNPPRRRATVPHVQTSQRPLSQHSQRESILSESVEPTKSYIRVKPGPHPHTATPYQRARLLLSHLGHVDFDGLKFGSFHMLGKTPALYRDIKVLDRKHG
ncbi:uncharacterized protein SPPG_06786 [Spizellomyces punctatus DAOM BR117]|uniref:Ral GTPase-activating protein subunit alpha/beta N-terminal domain-containing protein n=1 Tax=Spizellomyces punctatus (strain DAOM BR117) TaxID=645134 RepID=A0A0L0H8D8_SPIPD|nr:uncharacterized protein SPPG_06786 [Spizellomyces punctatus DAOM BR117]KNC97790.1 hypothetical protein SPPG_06786 [Spizellomyces punctatus DAOM BR117]|eukprot:XP_016605830.1 hypothetical protein SPPG_06786 [Spizellomyces punctatus DAOM BR117]